MPIKFLAASFEVHLILIRFKVQIKWKPKEKPKAPEPKKPAK